MKFQLLFTLTPAGLPKKAKNFAILIWTLHIPQFIWMFHYFILVYPLPGFLIYYQKLIL